MKPVIIRNPVLRFLMAALYYIVAVPVLAVAGKVFLGLKVQGRENVKKLRRQGFVLTCSHNHCLDCAAQGLLICPRKPVFTSQEPVFQRPVVGFLVRALGSVPVPLAPMRMKRFFTELSQAVKNGRVVVMYPEGELLPHCRELREFHDGAYFIAVLSGAPVVPAVVTFRRRRGLWRVLKRKPCVTVTAGAPLYPLPEKSPRRAAAELCCRAKKEMQRMMEEEMRRGGL